MWFSFHSSYISYIPSPESLLYGKDYSTTLLITRFSLYINYFVYVCVRVLLFSPFETISSLINATFSSTTRAAIIMFKLSNIFSLTFKRVLLSWQQRSVTVSNMGWLEVTHKLILLNKASLTYMGTCWIIDTKHKHHICHSVTVVAIVISLFELRYGSSETLDSSWNRFFRNLLYFNRSKIQRSQWSAYYHWPVKRWRYW